MKQVIIDLIFSNYKFVFMYVYVCAYTCKRREVKGKEEKERYTDLNAEFQRITRRDKKAFLNDKCKEIEENSRKGKTRHVFKKIRDIKTTFHAKISTIKERNGMDLTEAEDMKKRWQQYTQKLYKKDLMMQTTTMVWLPTWSQTSWNVKLSGP